MIPVAVYCRVSTDQEDQANSFEAQQRYFRDYIDNHPQWTLFDIYADEGITGTSTRKRTQFHRMLRDARQRKFRWILTKEVSRFSRNILDTIRCTRELKEQGIGVIFATDRINTLEPESEMLLSFLATLAQEESRRTSSRVVWGQTRQMERGVVFGRSLLGYDVKQGKLSIEPEGAETVRLIFHKYALEQLPAARIAEFLQQEQYRTGSGSTRWSANSVLKILRNEKYVGDLIQKKTYTPDYLSHAKKPNRGEVPLVTIENHHSPIIDRDLWDLTQQRLRLTNKHRASADGHSRSHSLSGKIRCGQCGGTFTAGYKYRKDGTGYRRWSCRTKGCTVGKLLREEDAIKMLQTALKNLPMDPDLVVKQVMNLVLGSVTAEEGDLQQIRRQIQSLQRKKERLLDGYCSGHIREDEMLPLKESYDKKLKTLENRLKEGQDNQENPDFLRQAICRQTRAILTLETESDVFCKTVLDSITVFPDRHMELKLKHHPGVFHFLG